jgi:hypothetical protein
MASDRVDEMRTVMRLWNQGGVDAWLAHASAGEDALKAADAGPDAGRG